LPAHKIAPYNPPLKVPSTPAYRLILGSKKPASRMLGRASLSSAPYCCNYIKVIKMPCAITYSLLPVAEVSLSLKQRPMNSE